jgi:Na+/melibiose symporter-like transporter
LIRHSFPTRRSSDLYLLEHYWWGSAFALSIPFAVVSLVMVFLFVPHNCGEEEGRVDHRGGVLSVVAIGALTLSLHLLPTPGELMTGAVLGLIAITALAIFIAWERRAPNPLFDLDIARRRPFWVAAVAGTIVFGSLVGSMFIGQQYMQNVLSFSALEAGIAILPAAAVMVVCSPLAARLIARHGGRTSFVVGFTAILAGLATMFTWRQDGSWILVVLAYGLLGAGIAFAGAPASRAVMTSVPLRRAGMGSGTNDLQRDLGAAIMQSLLGAFLTLRYANEMSERLAAVPADERSRITTETAATLQNSFSGSMDLAKRYPEYADAITSAAREAFTSGSALAIAIGIVCIVGGLILVVTMFPAREREEELERLYAEEQ